MADKPAKLIVRNAEVSDIPGIMEVSERVYGPGMGYARSELIGQLNRFPDGQFVPSMKVSSSVIARPS
jgi:hypothetical protein